jgi:hypothetical protein
VQTLRQLAPRTKHKDGLNNKAIQLCEETTKSRENAICALTGKYLHSAIRPLLLEPDHESVRNGLADIVAKAAEISYTLWTQKIHLFPQTLAIGDMLETYAHSDPLMDAHALHNKQIHEDETRLDGKPILLVAHPALVVGGYEDLPDDSAPTVLKKAVCWMGQTPINE